MDTKTWLDATLGFFYPPLCQVCRNARSSPEEGYVCLACRLSVKPLEQPYCRKCGLAYDGAITTSFQCANCHDLDLAFESARAGVHFVSPIREILHGYKYNRALWFEPFLGGLLLPVAGEVARDAGCTVIMAVPLHPLRLREREFNQAERLARWLSERLGLPFQPGTLERKEITHTQTLLKPKERFANVRRAFAFTSSEPLRQERVMLVDDVLTTGATTSACAEVLLRNGAASVHVCTVARGGL